MFEAMWLRHGETMPEGWRYANNEWRIEDHHTHYARMIVREVTTEQTTEERPHDVRANGP